VAHFNFAGKGGTRTKGDLRRKWPRFDLQGSSGNEVLRTGHQGDPETLSFSSYVLTENIRKYDIWWEDATCKLVPNVSPISTEHARFEVLAAVFVRLRVLLDMKLGYLTSGSRRFKRSQWILGLIDHWKNVITILWYFGKFQPTDTASQIWRHVS
jgi:hypothetical protein